MVALVRHRQTKGPATDRFHLNHRATPRLHPVDFGTGETLPISRLSRSWRGFIRKSSSRLKPSGKDSCFGETRCTAIQAGDLQTLNYARRGCALRTRVVRSGESDR